MTKLLHISASPRGDQSESLALARTFLAGVRASRPGLEIAHWDLWDGTLPAFGPAIAHAKMAVFAGREFSDRQAAAWTAVQRTFERFDAAQEYLFSIPMWNAGIPYILKQLIDVISQPGLIFGFDPHKGYTGLLRGKRAAVIYTSAVYGVDRPPDLRLRLPDHVRRGLAALGRHHRHHHRRVPTESGHRRRGGRRVEAHRRAAEIGREYDQSGPAEDRGNAA